MSSIHNTDYCSALRTRIDTLHPNAEHQWGVMRPDQMLHHLNQSMSIGLGKVRATPQKPPIPRPFLLPMALYLPFPKGKGQAVPETLAQGTYDFSAERARFHQLIEEFALKPLHFNWITHPIMGRLSGPSWSRLEAKHIDHHLRQFGA